MAKKKKAKVTAVRSSTTAKSAKEAAYGKTTEVYKKPTKPVKDVNSADYMGMTAKQKIQNIMKDLTKPHQVKWLKH
jgi:adenylate kinase family enzyme